MAGTILYLKLTQNAEVHSEEVYLKDVASLQCGERAVSAKCKSIRIHRFKEGESRTVISVLELIRRIEDTCPGVQVSSVGETDVLIERVPEDRAGGPGVWIKVALVCLVSFFGTAFTIMAFHNDININGVFDRVYDIIMGRKPSGVNILQVSYSVGLALGILVFFNHVGTRRITKDPTPIEVSMRNYESDVNKALIETADREGEEIDV